MEKINGGVTAAKGYFAAGVTAGVKKEGKDMALVYSEAPAVAAGVFTRNIVKAAPVRWCRGLLEAGGKAQAVILNSGAANACTGGLGDENNEKMAAWMGKALGIEKTSVFTASTGVIGKQLPMDAIANGVKLLKDQYSSSLEAGTLAAEAIMTTDTISKECAVRFTMGGKEVILGGMSKGSGMIHPDMATMLSVITTDAAISKELLEEAVKEDVKDSFNMISVDRDTSTNDTMLVLANGLAGNPILTEKKEEYQLFCVALAFVTKSLAQMMAGDGEGATKLFEVELIGAKTKEQAVLLSKSVITSNLVKTAIFGNDANWGRIICAMGYAGANFNPETVDLTIESEAGILKMVEDSVSTDYSEGLATLILSGKKVKAIIDIKQGTNTATAWGCDLTYDYVKINGDYRS